MNLRWIERNGERVLQKLIAATIHKEDGGAPSRVLSWQDVPLVELPKKKVKKSDERWVVMWEDGSFSETYFSDEKRARDHFDTTQKILKITITWEEEVDE